MKPPKDWNNMTDEEKIGYKSAIDDAVELLFELRKSLK
jgi:hypothetical protein|tara:strand:- start:376 stop:489 length:114 start_codon:yes stop_codon:yes gene_type:complete